MHMQIYLKSIWNDDIINRYKYVNDIKKSYTFIFNDILHIDLKLFLGF